jgi:hypothetical protein
MASGPDRRSNRRVRTIVAGPAPSNEQGVPDMRTMCAIAWLLCGAIGLAQAMEGPPVLGLPAPEGPATPTGTDVLYAQFEGMVSTAVISQDFPVASNVLDAQAADDFSVPFGESWQINAIDAAYARGGDGTYAGVGIHVFFFENGVGGQPGSLVATALSQAYTSGFDSGMETVSIVLASPVTLPAGSYWLSLQADEPYGGYWYWRGYRPQVGQGAMWRNPLDGYSSGCTTWTDLGGCFDTELDPDLQFRLRGTRGVATHNGVYHSSPLDHALAPTSVGTSLNLVSEALDEAGPLSGDWDLNFWSDSGTFGFFGLDTWNARFLVDEAGEVAVLHPGDTIGPAALFALANGPASAPAWLAGTDAYAGFRFDCNGRLTNPVGGGACYGYLRLTTSAPAGFPATLIDYAYDGDGLAITVAAPGDVIFCSGFDGGDSGGCDGASDEGIYTTRAQFLSNLAPGWFDLSFDEVEAGASAALEYDHAGTHVIVNTQPGASGGLYNLSGAVSTLNSGDMLSIHFSGAPVTAIGGNFWATDFSFEPSGTAITLYLSDGTVHAFDPGGPDAFRGFVSRVPLAYLHIDAPDAGGVNAWSTLDNLVVGVAR